MQVDWIELGRRLQCSIRPPREGTNSLFENTLIARQRSYSLFDGVRNKAGTSFSPHAGIKSDRVSNALSAFLFERHWILISEKLIGTLDSLFSLLAKASNDCPLFTPGQVFEPSRFTWPSEQNATQEFGLESAYPTNVLLTGYMAHVALRYAADHEFFHGFHGHLLLIEELFRESTHSALTTNGVRYDHDIRLALELEADRSAVTQHVVDLLDEATPTNDAVEDLSQEARISLIFVSIAILMSLWASEEERTLSAGNTHPRWETRLYMLLGPTFVRSLSLVGFEQSAVTAIQWEMMKQLGVLQTAHPIFRPIMKALEYSRMQIHQTESRRLEMVYRLTVAPKLARYQFSGHDDSDPRIISVR